MEEIALSMATTVPVAGLGHGWRHRDGGACTAIAGAPSLDKGAAYVSRHHSLVGGGTDLRDHSPPPVRPAPLAPANYAPQTATPFRDLGQTRWDQS